ncbi:hypothetical protein N8385_02290 [Cyclobacteriaceae bacterium]|nr:hypothetical protein [Cyclobacteriaceae bacterium]
MPEVEAPEIISIDSIQSILTWVFNDEKRIWDGIIPVHGKLQLNGDTLVGLDLKLSIQELQVKTKLPIEEKNALMNAWLNPTLFDADSFPEIRLMVQSEVNSTKKRNLKLNKDPFFGPLSAKILIKNKSYDILLQSSLLDTDNHKLSIRFILDTKTWTCSKNIRSISSNKYIDIRIFIVLKQ